jgi:hypothetical protein
MMMVPMPMPMIMAAVGVGIVPAVRMVMGQAQLRLGATGRELDDQSDIAARSYRAVAALTIGSSMKLDWSGANQMRWVAGR